MIQGSIPLQQEKRKVMSTLKPPTEAWGDVCTEEKSGPPHEENKADNEEPDAESKEIDVTEEARRQLQVEAYHVATKLLHTR